MTLKRPDPSTPMKLFFLKQHERSEDAPLFMVLLLCITLEVAFAAG